jgi:hypothetical protein
LPRSAPDAVPLRSDYGEGSYRRCIVLDAAPGRAYGELADDFHHFAATTWHDGVRVTAVRGEAIRVPWTTCPGAVEPLTRLVGVRIALAPGDVARHTDARAQCTHLYDAACLAVRHADRFARGGAATRRYDFVLPDLREGRSRPTLHRDGEPILAWEISGLAVTEATPGPFAGCALSGRAFAERLAAIDDADLVEAALVMRRAVFIGLGRRYDFDRIERATSFAPVVGAACHTFSPAHVGTARHVAGNVRDFHAAPERILDRDDAVR